MRLSGTPSNHNKMTITLRLLCVDEILGYGPRVADRQSSVPAVSEPHSPGCDPVWVSTNC